MSESPTNEHAVRQWRGLSHSPDDTQAIGSAIASLACESDIIALEGDLGAGKTQFVRGMARALGIDAHHVASPTFVLMHEYDATDRDLVLVHIDAYRLRDAADLSTIGWDAADSGAEVRRGAIAVVECADRIPDALGDGGLRVRIEHRDGSQRRLTIDISGDWTDRVDKLIQSLKDFAEP